MHLSARHGDVILDRIAEDGARGREILPDARGDLILVEGSATGHGHRVSSANAALFVDPSDENAKILVVNSATNLSHEEHATERLEAGTYSVRVKRQHDPEGGWWPVED